VTLHANPERTDLRQRMPRSCRFRGPATGEAPRR
jgi:hypothetical protein